MRRSRLIVPTLLFATVAACKSGPSETATTPAAEAPAEVPARVVPPIPDPLPTDPFEALDALLELPYRSHFGDAAQHRASGQRIVDAIDRAMRASEDPARFAALQTAGVVLAAAPNGGAYEATQREWRSLRSRMR